MGADQQERRLEKDAELFVGDYLETGAASVIQVLYIDGGRLAVRPHSQVYLEDFHYQADVPEENKSSIGLLQGGLRAITGAVGKLNPDQVKYKTPVATIGIRGTDIEIYHIPADGHPDYPGMSQGSYLYVNSGAAFMQVGGVLQEVNPGQSVFTHGQQGIIFAPFPSHQSKIQPPASEAKPGNNFNQEAAFNSGLQHQDKALSNLLNSDSGSD